LLSIKGLLSLVELNIGDTALIRQYLGLIGTSINRLDGTIIEILDYSRNSRLNIQIDHFNIREVIETIYEDLKPQVESDFDFELTFVGSEMVHTDKMRFTTILKNIIANGVKYRKKRELASFIHIVVENQSDFVKIKVSDNGEGISIENQSKVFNMFYRASKSSSGTGLGLYICREMISKLDGEIKLSSDLSIGTTIEITLPQHITT
jgi:signal transduction histidine kinase